MLQEQFMTFEPTSERYILVSRFWLQSWSNWALPRTTIAQGERGGSARQSGPVGLRTRPRVQAIDHFHPIFSDGHSNQSMAVSNQSMAVSNCMQAW